MVSMMFAAALAALTLAAPRAIDGDTIDSGGVRYRLAGIDAPETRGARCVHERILGVVAQARLQSLLSAGPVVATAAHEPRGPARWPRDRYGRRLAHVIAGEVNVAQRLIQDGLAAPYAGGRRPDWCAILQAPPPPATLGRGPIYRVAGGQTRNRVERVGRQ